MAYDASETVKALERPSITVERDRWWHYVFGIRALLGPTKTYTGRIVSHPEWVPLQQRWIEAGSLADADAHELIRDTCKAIGIPPKVVLRLPGRVMQEALTDFLACQSRAHLPSDGTKTKATRRSPRATASRNGSPKKTNEHGIAVT